MRYGSGGGEGRLSELLNQTKAFERITRDFELEILQVFEDVLAEPLVWLTKPVARVIYGWTNGSENEEWQRRLPVELCNALGLPSLGSLGGEAPFGDAFWGYSSERVKGVLSALGQGTRTFLDDVVKAAVMED